jgi:release factor glutamine methyltransferase
MNDLDTPATVKEALEDGTARLRSGRIQNPSLVSELLLLHILRVKRTEMYLNLNQKLTEVQLKGFYGLLGQRLAGKPVQYITNSANFFGFELYIDQNALIPRPETEILAETVIKKLTDLRHPASIVDWGTGSGNIAIALASHLDCRVYAVDISERALQIARRNVSAYNLKNKIKFFLGTGFSALPADLRKKIDAVVANPPYIRPEQESVLPREVKDHEPKEALFDKKDGLHFTREIIAQAGDFLKTDGFLALEIALGQAEKVSEVIQNSRAYRNLRIVSDLVGIERIVTAHKK